MDDLLTLIDEFDPILKDEFLNAVYKMQDSIERFILENYPLDSDEIPPENELDNYLQNTLETHLSQGFEANLTALHEKAELPIIFLLSVPKFDTNILKNEFIKLEIQSIVSESKQAIKIAGLNKNRIFETIGLTTNQAKSLISYRKALENIANGKTQTDILDSKIIRNLSASQRSAVRNALAKGIEPKDVNTFVNKQRKALLINRAKAIGSSLASKTAHTAQQTVIDLAVRTNLVKPNQFKRFWITAHDEKVRQAHNQTESMNSQGVDLNQPFQTPLGPVMNPPLEINCRCHVSVRKTDV